jgi:hypothetical protein
LFALGISWSLQNLKKFKSFELKLHQLRIFYSKNKQSNLKL